MYPYGGKKDNCRLLWKGLSDKWFTRFKSSLCLFRLGSSWARRCLSICLLTLLYQVHIQKESDSDQWLVKLLRLFCETCRSCTMHDHFFFFFLPFRKVRSPLMQVDHYWEIGQFEKNVVSIFDVAYATIYQHTIHTLFFCHQHSIGVYYP